jgi:hypothetical protein
MSRIENLLYNGIWVEKNYIQLIGDERKKLGFWGFWGEGDRALPQTQEDN